MESVVLADGRGVALRPVVARDATALQGFFRALAAATRHMRFHIGIRELPPDLLRAMTDVDQRCHVAIVAEAEQGAAAADIVAEARYVRSRVRGEAEFALTVADAWQGAGLGRELLLQLMRHAHRRGITRLVGDVVHANAPMLALVRNLGGCFDAVADDPTLLRAVFDMRGAPAVPPQSREIA